MTTNVREVHGPGRCRGPGQSWPSCGTAFGLRLVTSSAPRRRRATKHDRSCRSATSSRS